MGFAEEAATSQNEYAAHLPAVLLAFPSPASIHESVESPPSSWSEAGDRPSAHWTPGAELSDAASTFQTLPGDVKREHVTTPPSDDTTQPNMNLLVGGALAPVQTVGPPPSVFKAGPGLRLPSFEALGIASPHPDRWEQREFENARTGGACGLTIDAAAAANADSDLLQGVDRSRIDTCEFMPKHGPVNMGGRAVQSSVKHYIATLTPPAEGGEIGWHSVTAISAAPIDSPSTDSGQPASRSHEAHLNTGHATAGTLSPIIIGGIPVVDDRPWMEGALRALLANLHSGLLPSNPLRVLSHALPSPSATGHIFPTVIGAIHNSIPASPTVWVNVFHAIPGRFNLADLPTSPPNTPGPPIGGEDYFTQKVFDSAVPIFDYQEDLSSLPRSPRPVVPPSSINVSVVERYIPPTSANEFSDMFNPSGPSILVDRLVELSPTNGSLVFIYPTKIGAQTFMREYLAPIIDPLLRSIVVVNGLSTDLSRILGNMIAADRLQDYATLKRSIVDLCVTLTHGSSGIHGFHGKRASFTLSHASSETVRLSRGVWARDWWTKQEKPRIRDVVTRFAHEAQKKSSNEHVERPTTPAELIQQILDGVIKKPYQAGQEPVRGVEIGVFVITRAE